MSATDGLEAREVSTGQIEVRAPARILFWVMAGLLGLGTGSGITLLTRAEPPQTESVNAIEHRYIRRDIAQLEHRLDQMNDKLDRLIDKCNQKGDK